MPAEARRVHLHRPGDHVVVVLRPADDIVPAIVAVQHHEGTRRQNLQVGADAVHDLDILRRGLSSSASGILAWYMPYWPRATLRVSAMRVAKLGGATRCACESMIIRAALRFALPAGPLDRPLTYPYGIYRGRSAQPRRRILARCAPAFSQ